MFVSGRSGTKVSRRDDDGDADEESSSSDGDNVMSRPVPGGASKMSPSRARDAPQPPDIAPRQASPLAVLADAVSVAAIVR